jgi:transposase
MARNLVNVDRDTPMLLPADLREWIAAEDPVHFVVDAVDQIDLRLAVVNERGTGSAQYPAAMMVALLVYCYGQGLYSSRRIERATYINLSVRYLTGDTHPDHDTIANFRRANEAVLKKVFVEVLRLGREMKMKQLGTICLDGTKLKANASTRHNAKEAKLRAELARLEEEVAKRITEANVADGNNQGSEEQLPLELADRSVRIAKLKAARAAISERAKAEKREVDDDDRGNTTDPESRLQRTSGGFVQGYNAQLAVSVEHGLITAAHVCPENQDRQQLKPLVEATENDAGPISNVVADTGYDSHEQVTAVAKLTKATVFIPPQEPVESKHRQSALRAAVTQERIARRDLVRTEAGQQMMRLRRCVVEPVFGIFKSAWKFTHFHLRGLNGANIEWLLLCTAYNLRKLHRFTVQRAA